MTENSPNEPKQDPKQDRPGGPVRMPKPAFGWLLFAGIGLMLVLLLSSSFGASAKEITISEFWNYAENGEIAKLVVKNDMLEGELRSGDGQAPGDKPRFVVKYPPNAIENQFMTQVRKLCPDAEISYEQNPIFVTVLISLIPWILIFGFIWFFAIRQLRNAGGGPGGMLGSFGRSRHRIATKEHTNITFGDVAGIDEAKEEVT